MPARKKKEEKIVEMKVVGEEKMAEAKIVGEEKKPAASQPTFFQYLVSSALGALVGGIPSGLFFLCCCLFQVIGGFAAGIALRVQIGRRITTLEAATVGAVGGFAGGAMQGVIETAKALYLPDTFGSGASTLVFAGVFVTAIYVVAGVVLGIAGAMLATLWE